MFVFLSSRPGHLGLQSLRGIRVLYEGLTWQALTFTAEPQGLFLKAPLGRPWHSQGIPLLMGFPLTDQRRSFLGGKNVMGYLGRVGMYNTMESVLLEHGRGALP